MNKVKILGLAVFASVMTSCESSSNPESAVNEDTIKAEQTLQQDTTSAQSKSDTLKVTGVISKIENGKDGYMATLKDSTGKEFVATISIINLQKSGGQFKRYKEGEKITVAGPSWKDDANLEHITVTNIE
ncbi:hypothetical protein LZZ85_17935 [Terrimonas sp. NA20]|uniref:DNA-binding protein n=1 Tax=Terrimonas ginsenosidimutans TaxID=2908004 RepID=A0ABS9KV60_9BACT|nr:hypothetical protein [Terrimonas ginsenosidimutans]MCG2616183.1 hypothetical protein [Terrimonas ginsenosidimutans]